MSVLPDETALTDAALAVAGVTDVFPPPNVLRDPPETLAALMRRDLAALAKVDLDEDDGRIPATARIGADATVSAADTGCAVAETIAARLGSDRPVAVVVRVTRIS